MSKTEFLYFVLVLCPEISVSNNKGTKVFELKGIFFMLFQYFFDKRK